jgi:hypothetical protein
MKPRQKEQEDLFTLLQTIKDYRRKQGQRHKLEVILLIIIMAIMAGAKGERAISRFAKNNKKALIQALKIERKEVPTRCIIQRTIQNVDFSELQQIFYQWALKIVRIQKKDIVSIDGKALRGTVTEAQNNLQNFTSLVSVFASKRKQVLTATKIDTKKESEIPAVQELIKMLDLQNVTFTLDALHCQEKTIKTIKETGNHYIIGVKNNQKKLSQDIKKM